MKKLGMLIVFITGCVYNEYSSYPDAQPPFAPRGVYSVTGDEVVYLYWIPNNEPDLAGYRVWRSYYAQGPYEAIGETNYTSFSDYSVNNGITYFYAVSAFDFEGNESELSYEIVFDTPRPEGFASLWSYLIYPDEGGYDFSRYRTQDYNDPETDFYYEYDENLYAGFIYARDEDTWVQDMGYTENFNEIGYAPEEGWSSLGVLEAIEGHCYIFWTRDNHFAKIRVRKIRSDGSFEFEWAYQTDPGNRELVAPFKFTLK